MNAATNVSGRCDPARARRLIRGLWNREERDRRRRLANSKQRELWRLLVTPREDVTERRPTPHAAVL